MNCTAPGCTAPAVRQWTRAGTTSEAQAYRDGLHARTVERAERAAAQAAIQVSELGDRRAAMLAAGTATPQVLAVLDRQITAAQQTAATASPEPARHAALEPVTIPVAGCEQHAVDEDAAAGVHHETCTAGACACTPTHPEQHTV